MSFPGPCELGGRYGHVESMCLRDRGLLGTQDKTLKKHVLAEDFTPVTVSARDLGVTATAARADFARSDAQ
jgi:hypothetical protein